jgi:hypothetical protein
MKIIILTTLITASAPFAETTAETVAFIHKALWLDNHGGGK